MSLTPEDPFDPDHGDFRDDAEGATDGNSVLSVDGSELLPGGED